MLEGVRLIAKEKKYPLLFSFCSIITNTAEYNLMQQTFFDKGFTDNLEFLIADNTAGNEFDAYTAINRFLQEAKGKYIIIVHQDIRCVDYISQLLESLNKLELQDPSWAVCGNAGSCGYKNPFYCINDHGRLRRSDHLPAKVSSLDENLLIIKNGCNLSVSSDIKDFHFYGTDLCMIADYLGYSCYVIAFMVEHLSKGDLKKLHSQEKVFIKRYGNKLRNRFVQTTCTKFYLSNSVFKNHFYNKPFIFFWIKAATLFTNLFKR